MESNFGNELSSAFIHAPKFQRKESNTLSRPPKSVSGHYVRDYNILRVHSIIMDNFQYDETCRLGKLQQKLQTVESQLTNPLTVVARMSLEEKQRTLRRRIDDIVNGTQKNEYLRLANPLIDSYRKLGTYMRMVAAENIWSEKANELEPKDQERLITIEKYLTIASNWIQVNVFRTYGKQSCCDVCGSNLSIPVGDNLGSIECSVCGAERQLIVPGAQNKESARTSSQRNDYNNWENFYKAFLRYQGLQPTEIPNELFEALDAYFQPLGLSRHQLADQPILENGRRLKTDHVILYTALEEIGYTEYYEDANLIGHKYWGWRLPNVMHIKELIEEDYKKTQLIYATMPRERSSSLGTQYRLFKHLELRNHPCSINEFKIAENRESIGDHDALWKQMCDKCNDKGIFFIPSI